MQQFPGKLHHKPPPWVPDTAIFHIRIRCLPTEGRPLTHPDVAEAILRSVTDYTERCKWSCFLMVLLPDHLHALMSFGRSPGMSATIGVWKRARNRFQGIVWQDNYFDHRIRSESDYTKTYHYIARNPVALGLCSRSEEWPFRISAFSAASIPRF